VVRVVVRGRRPMTEAQTVLLVLILVLLAAAVILWML
jgi:hypothetical protein